MKRIAVCADDFGQSSEIDAGIIELARRGCLSAASCMSLGPSFKKHVDQIKSLPIDTGLHLNFTESFGRPGFYLPLSKLLGLSYLKKLDERIVSTQIEEQLNAFESEVGAPPDFIDGHQHVHQLPVIRECLFKIVEHRYPGHRFWIRNTAAAKLKDVPFRLNWKAHLIAKLGSHALGLLAAQRNYPMNRRFLGVYDFTERALTYPQWLSYWLENAGDCDLVMCHPAKAVTQGDALGQMRVSEFDALTSKAFEQLLTQHQLKLVRLSQSL